MEFLAIPVAALIVGTIVGITGMGGGALMTPILILLGVHPSVAVANDLVAAAFSKSLGAGIHWRKGNPHMELVKWLVIGSVPSAFLGSFIVSSMGPVQKQDVFIKLAIGGALLLTAAAYTLRVYASEYKSAATGKRPAGTFHPRPLPTLILGIIGGLLVGITSVGAGSIIMVALIFLYPSMKAVDLVGTDLVQAVPLVISAAIAHTITSGIQWEVFIPVIIGSMTGTFIGSHIAYRVNQKVVRRALVVVLIISGSTMLGVPPLLSIPTSLAALVIGVPLLKLPINNKRKQLAGELEV